jgi:hypothetical protein
MSQCAYMNLINYEWGGLEGIEGNLISIDENREAQVGGMMSAASGGVRKARPRDALRQSSFRQVGSGVSPSIDVFGWFVTLTTMHT